MQAAKRGAAIYRKIMVALDGSEASEWAADLALAFAAGLDADVLGCHVYSAGMHGRRFRDMEPGLPDDYQETEALARLRGSHDSLIADGFRALSHGFLDGFLESARREGVRAEAVTAEGRNYVGILDIAQARGANLVAVGADGVGADGDGLLGSTTARVLRHARCDVLIARRQAAGGPVLVGIDGSPEALSAMEHAAAWACALDRPLHLVAAYDPDFHTVVFRTMARRLSAERADAVGLAEQEDLHDRIINDGLAQLYRAFLGEAALRCEALGVSHRDVLLKGKAYRAVAEYACEAGVDLVAVGRYGHHRERVSDVGSNAEALARVCRTNVLVTASAGAARAPDVLEAERAESAEETVAELQWDADARARLERIPGFARPMARRAIEEAVRARGGTRVTGADMDEARRRFGMGGEGHG
jgi:nucleotide-binding universal stress UspA family protein